MNHHKTSFTERIKASAQKMFEKETSLFQTFDQEYKISSHPIKRTFIAIGKLNSIHKGSIGIQEIADEAKLPKADIEFIIQEFIEQRLIDGYIKENKLILKQDYYHCQIDQTEHTVFDLHFQCVQCLRFICASCYQNGYGSACPYCKGSLRPVPRIFKESDVQSALYNPRTIKESMSEYYQTQKYHASQEGIRKVSSRIIEDLKSFREGKSFSFSSLKERGKKYWNYRKHENIISKNEKVVLDTISAIYEIEENSEISLLRIAKLTSLEIDLLHEIISKLITQQTINGFIETQETYDQIFDDKLILGSNLFHCEIHSKDLPMSDAHYQCSSCFRMICVPCFEEIKNQGIAGCLFCNGQLTFYPEATK